MTERDSPETIGSGASRRVSRGIMKAIETGQIAPGQRLVETDLAGQYAVGRNAVREAIQWLAAHGAIDVTRYRSAAIRQLDLAETRDVLDVAETMVALMARAAALRYREERHSALLPAAMAEFERANDADMPGSFSRARRHFYRALLEIGGNRELQRLFPSLGIHIVHAQYRASGLRLRTDEIAAMTTAVSAGNADAAHALGRAQIERIRAEILALASSG